MAPPGIRFRHLEPWGICFSQPLVAFLGCAGGGCRRTAGDFSKFRTKNAILGVIPYEFGQHLSGLGGPLFPQVYDGQ